MENTLSSVQAAVLKKHALHLTMPAGEGTGKRKAEVSEGVTSSQQDGI